MAQRKQELKDEEAMYEEDNATDIEEHGTDHYDSEDPSDVFIGPAEDGDFDRLQRDFYQKYSVKIYRKNCNEQQ